MKTKNFVISQEKLELFENAVDFKAFFEATLKTPTEFASLEEWITALREYEFYKNDEEFKDLFSYHNLFDTYEDTCKALENFKIRGTFSKKFKSIFYRDVTSFYSYEALKNHIYLVSTAVREKKAAAGDKGRGPVMQKLVENQRENEKESKIPFYKRIVLQPCGWALLAAGVFLYFMKIH